MMNIYIFNLHSAVGDQELKELFAPYGDVRSAQVVKDVISGESRGFGHVEIMDDAAAQKAINHLNGTELQTLTIFVEESRPADGSGVTASNFIKPVEFNNN
jgi:RNA recognition motif-containing protein